MWFMVAAVCLLMWLSGIGLFHVTGNSIHLLAVLALFAFGLHVVQWRRRKVVKA